MRGATAIFRVAKYLPGTIDSQRVCEREAGVGGNERVKIDLRTAADDKRLTLNLALLM